MLVTLNANGGTVSPSTREVFRGFTIGALPTPTLDDYKFEGWYTEDGTRVSSSTVVNSDITYYAHWKPAVVFSPTLCDVPAVGGRITTTMTTDFEWSAKADVSWISVDSGALSGINEVVWKVDANPSSKSRTGTITFTYMPQKTICLHCNASRCSLQHSYVESKGRVGFPK